MRTAFSHTKSDFRRSKHQCLLKHMQDVPTPHLCEGNVRRKALRRLATSNRQTFMCLTALDCEGAIRVDPQNLARTNPRGLELIGGGKMILDKDKSTNLTIKMRTPRVFTLQAQIRLQLSVLRNGNYVSDNGNVQQHVTTKHQSPRSNAIKRR